MYLGICKLIKSEWTEQPWSSRTFKTEERGFPAWALFSHSCILWFSFLLDGKVTFILAQRLVESSERPCRSSSYRVHQTHRVEQTWKYLGLGVFFFSHPNLSFVLKEEVDIFVLHCNIHYEADSAPALAPCYMPFLWQHQFHSHPSCCTGQKRFSWGLCCCWWLTLGISQVERGGSSLLKSLACPLLFHTGGVGGLGSLLWSPPVIWEGAGIAPCLINMWQVCISVCEKRTEGSEAKY